MVNLDQINKPSIFIFYENADSLFWKKYGIKVLGTKITGDESSWGQETRNQNSGPKIPTDQMSCNSLLYNKDTTQRHHYFIQRSFWHYNAYYCLRIYIDYGLN